MFNKQRGEGTRLVSRKSDKEDVNSENEGESSTTSTSSDEPSVSDGLQLQPTTSKTHAPPQTQYTQPTIEAEDEDESEVIIPILLLSYYIYNKRYSRLRFIY